MAILISAHQLSHSFAGRSLFKNISFSIQEGERVGLIGPNGAGKTTLLKIIGGFLSPDEGTLSSKKSLRIGFLEQVPQFKKGFTVRQTLEEKIEDLDDWKSHALVDEYLSKLSLDGSQSVSPETPVELLSGGWKKRVALARELVCEPDLLLLDEPTNHLDIESILWLEEFIARSPIATLTITHDRVFLQKVSNRILELDRRNPAGLLSVNGSYADYVDLKAQNLHEQEQKEAILKNTLRRETEWLRRGPKARTTKQQARIDRAGDLKDEVEQLSERNRSQKVSIDFQSSGNQPKKLIDAKKISKSYDHKVLFSDLDLLLTSGTRLGLLGANGSGKSTLIRVLLGLESPDQGKIDRADQLSIAFFEQNRETLDPNQTLVQAICPEGDYVNYRGNFIHIRGYLDRFLFKTEQMSMKVGKLSGGEQSRLLIARLMLKPANLLVLDEPTNDLDLETLNILQECLLDFQGAIILVTHDRYFLDQVATKILAFHPIQEIASTKLEYFADLFQWEDWFKEEQKKFKNQQSNAKSKTENGSKTNPPKKRKLSFKEQFEFEQMEKTIHLAEEELQKLIEESEHAENRTNAIKLTELTQKIAERQTKIEKMYQRWAELESLQSE